jgi:hypothetical protein
MMKKYLRMVSHLVFASPSILEMTGATRALPDAVQLFFGIDPHVEGKPLAILDAAR